MTVTDLSFHITEIILFSGEGGLFSLPRPCKKSKKINTQTIKPDNTHGPTLKSIIDVKNIIQDNYVSVLRKFNIKVEPPSVVTHSKLTFPQRYVERF